MRFRPCIDLHEGKVKQIVGSSLDEQGQSLQTNFVASQSPAYFAELYRRDSLSGGHVIMLGPGNEDAAIEALAAYPQGLQIGGGISPENARFWLQRGAAKLIVTSYVFPGHDFSLPRLRELSELIGPDRLVLDLSCRPQGEHYYVACNRWQNLSSLRLDADSFAELAQYCSEFLVHAVEVEGKQAGIDSCLLETLARHCSLPLTYAGGIASMQDIEKIEKAGKGRIDFTVGSTLDIFGGKLLKYEDLKVFN